MNEDGKLSLSPHEKAYLQIDRDAKLIMDTIESYDAVFHLMIRRDLLRSNVSLDLARLLLNVQLDAC